MFKDFFVRKIIESKMKNVPKEQQEMVIGMIEKNPELFQKIVMEIQTEVEKGKDQMAATMEVMKRYEAELKGLSD
jgi:hypothetical protein